MRWRRHRGLSYDIVTRTERERRDDEIETRRKRYFAIMIPCLTLVAFGFFVPAPTPVRVVALAFAAVLPPIAAIVGNARPR
jgi:Na+/H+ antiporter NhaD/arsenite permease-like protein